MADPTVTVVSDERLREFAFGPRHTAPLFAEMESMARELLRARPAPADVGECERCPQCRGTNRIQITDTHYTTCGLCRGTGKQPRPAAEAKCECGHAKMPGMTRCLNCNDLSPAAHTAQGDDTQRMDWLEEHSSPSASDCQWRCHERLNGRSVREAIDDAMSRLAEQGEIVGPYDNNDD